MSRRLATTVRMSDGSIMSMNLTPGATSVEA
jgi:hypothetical protein